MDKRVQDIEIKDFTYDLPESRIAKYPLPERDSSKLLIYRDGAIQETTYSKIADFLPQHSLLIFNNTKVIQARLNFKNLNGARIEIFCLEPGALNPEYATAMSQQGSVEWKCFIGRLVKWKEKVITKNASDLSLNAEMVGESGGVYTIRFTWQPEQFSFAEILQHFGEMPIPPYMKRESEKIDESRYQTVYAREDGSVAAPTAGLHFTDGIFESLGTKSISTDFVTLHVGAGTFKPVKSDTMAGHDMHAEWIEVRREFVEKILMFISNAMSEQKIIAVGTTSLRTLESLYWMGVKASINPDSTLDQLEILQWDAYDLPQEVNPADAMRALLSWMDNCGLQNIFCRTKILIAPAYKLKTAKALITNFHQPNSTLLLLVAAVVGSDWQMIYNYALRNDFRFLSYGDGSLLFSK